MGYHGSNLPLALMQKEPDLISSTFMPRFTLKEVGFVVSRPTKDHSLNLKFSFVAQAMTSTCNGLYCTKREYKRRINPQGNISALSASLYARSSLSLLIVAGDHHENCYQFPLMHSANKQCKQCNSLRCPVSTFDLHLFASHPGNGKK